jgi:hypothetical protein
VAYTFQIGGKIKSKLLTGYESELERSLLLIDSLLQTAKKNQYSQFYFVVSGLKITGHGKSPKII